MKAHEVTFDTDEGGLVLKLKAEEESTGSTLDLWVTVDAMTARIMYRSLVNEFAEVVALMDSAEAAVKSGSYVPPSVAQQLLDDGVYDNDPAKRYWAERVARGEQV